MDKIPTDTAEHLQVEQIQGLIAAAGVDGAGEIYNAFWQSSADLLADLAAQVNDNNFDLASQTAHALKGSAANVGASRLAQTATQIEAACKSCESETIHELLVAAQQDFAVLRRHLDAYLANS